MNTARKRAIEKAADVLHQVIHDNAARTVTLGHDPEWGQRHVRYAEALAEAGLLVIDDEPATPKRDSSRVTCSRAKTSMTPCIARDGSTALADDKGCVGCGIDPSEELADLATKYPPAITYRGVTDPDEAADRLTEMVWAYVTAKEDGRA